MKLSEMREWLQELENKWGDIEIVRYYIDEDDLELPIEKNNFSGTQDADADHIEYVRFWV